MSVSDSGKRWLMAIALSVGVWGWSPFLGGSMVSWNCSFVQINQADASQHAVSEPSPWSNLDRLLHRTVSATVTPLDRESITASVLPARSLSLSKEAP